MRKSSLAVAAALAVLWGGPLPAAESPLDVIAERAKVRYDAVPRRVLAFYYPWYGNPEVPGGSGRWAHWEGVDQARRQIKSSTHYPTLGPYDSHDRKSIAQHCAWARQAGIDTFIVSWWGANSFCDQAMKPVLDVCHEAGIAVSAYYETVPRPGDAETAARDVVGLLERHADHPAWLCVDGKPVVFVYGRAVQQIGLVGWLDAIGRINRDYARKAVLIGDAMSRSAARVFDGIHTYNTASALASKDLTEVHAWAKATFPKWVEAADASGRISTLTVIPGYDDTKIRTPGLKVERAGGALYREQWEQTIAADPHWVLITSFNEWHEGSDVEPSDEYGERYLAMTAEMAARFKDQGPRARREPARPDSAMSEAAKARQLARLGRMKIGLLPDPGLAVLWPLLHRSPAPTLFTWEQVADWPDSVAGEYPIVIYAGGESYRRTVRRAGDVDEAIVAYLKAGGFLVVLPSGPMPFHYDREHRAVQGSSRFGLPLSVAGADGGWEAPPKGKDLRFVRVGERLPNVPESFPFPREGDLRWRPFVRGRLAEGDRFVPLVELRDEDGTHYGDAVAFVEHRASEPKNARVLYAWFELLNTPQGEAVLYDVLAFAAGEAGAK